jgi:hypothetical protein
VSPLTQVIPFLQSPSARNPPLFPSRLKAHLLQHNTLGVRRTTGRRGLVDVTESSLLVSLVGPSVLPSRGSKGSSSLESTGFA